MRVRTEEKRREILAVARPLFRERGYAETSMAEISSRLGGSKGTLYSYFSSKEELFVVVMLEMVSGAADALLAELEKIPDMRVGLASVIQKIIRIVISPEVVELRRMLVAEAGRSQLGRLAYEQGAQRYLKKTADLFAAQMRAGFFREADPWVIALHLNNLATGYPAQLVLEGAVPGLTDAQIAAAAEQAADVILRAYAIGPPAEAQGRARPGRGRR